MMKQPAVDWRAEVEVADWIARRLHPFHAYDVGSVVPSGFPAYARILHPASRPEGDDYVKVRWADIAAQSGRVVHPRMQFESICRGSSGVHEPETGALDRDESLALIETLREFTTTPDRCWFCIWDGYGWLNAGAMGMLSPERGIKLPPIVPDSVLAGPRVRLPQRDYLLYRGPVTAALALCGYPWNQTPNLWWPEDRAWCVASEIDLPCTYVGGDVLLIERLLSDARLEALPAELTDSVTAGSDLVNG